MKSFEDAKILIVDDMPSVQRMIGKMLESFGAQFIIYASNGSMALEMIHNASTPIDLILCDWNMPIMTGIELLREVKSDDRYKKIPFIMVTAEGEKQKIIEAITLGVNQYITKPIERDNLRRKIEHFFPV